MPTKHDIFEPGFIYHIYNRAVGNDLLFYSKRNYYYFLKLLNQKLSGQIEIHAFCLMNNHFHLLAKVKETTNHQSVSAAFKRFGISFAQSINKQEDRKGSLFMRPIKRKRIISEDYYRKVIIYIHRNPINHGVVRSFGDYYWSSFPIFVSTHNDLNLLFSMRDIFSLERSKEILNSHFEDVENFIFCHKKPSKNQFLDEVEFGD